MTRFKILMLLPPVLVLLLVSVLVAFGQTDSPSSAQAAAQGGVSTQRFEDYVRAHQREHELLALAITEARKVIDLRLEGMNELRTQINTERGTYEPRSVSEATKQRNDERLNKLEQAIAAQDGRNATWFAAFGVFVVIVNLVAFKFMPKLPMVNRRGR